MPSSKKEKKQDSPDQEICPKCQSPLGPITETPTGKRLQRCSQGTWNPETRKTEGCDYVKWLETPPEETDEKCPKCGSPVVVITTRFGKRAKKCSTGGWDRETKQSTGCDYIEWLNKAVREELEEECPECGNKLLMVTTANGKRLKKCSTAGWDRQKKEATGCTYVEWQNSFAPKTYGAENFPAEPV